MLLAAQGLLAARARRCAADLPASDGATSCSAQKSCRRKRLQGHRQRSRCSPRDLMHRRRLVMCSVPSCVAVVLLTGLSSRAARDGVLGRSSDRRPRTGGARREHRHACGARRDARRRARRGRRGRLALGVGTRRRTCARARATIDSTAMCDRKRRIYRMPLARPGRPTRESVRPCSVLARTGARQTTRNAACW